MEGCEWFGTATGETRGGVGDGWEGGGCERIVVGGKDGNQTCAEVGGAEGESR